MPQEYIIEIKDLTKVYRGAEEPAVDKLSLNITANEIFGLLGPNGAGKTTTISILCGIMKPTSGTVRIFGKDIHSEMDAIKHSIGVVPQDLAIYPTLTARENLTFFGKMYGLHGPQLKERMDECLEMFGLEKSARKLVSTYSGGMKRRLNLVAGLMHKPKILFLDEPTVGIDVQSKNVILEHLIDIRNEGTTLIYTSHYMEEAESLCSTVAIIDMGKIVTLGKPSELLRQHPDCTNLEGIFLKLTGRHLRD